MTQRIRVFKTHGWYGAKCGEMRTSGWFTKERAVKALRFLLTSASTRPGELAGLEDAPTIETHAVARPAGDA